LDKKFCDLSDKIDSLPTGALVTATIYVPGGGAVVEKGFIVETDEASGGRQLPLFPTALLYVLSTHTTELVFASQIIDILSFPQ
jgi:hypothetical protein